LEKKREKALVNYEDKVRSYVLGYVEPEKRRLLTQAQLYDPYTEAFLHKAGIQKGMKVLDVGSGIGNLSLLASKLVGSEGQVTGIDADKEVSRIASQRVQKLGIKNVSFVIGDVFSFDLNLDFDAIIGRLFLLHIKDPATLLKHLVLLLRPGGLIAFEEIAALGTAIPICSNIEYIYSLYAKLAEKIGIDFEFGYKLPRIFQTAGLGTPHLEYFAPIGTGPDWLGYQWLVEGIRTFMPTIQQFNLASVAEIDIDTLENRIREEVVMKQSTVTLLPHIAAWETV
jgi:ubiquinone/menaquinone biosynthesis C-methylase UbiE